MALQVRTTQLAHADQRVAGTVSSLDTLTMICGSRHARMAGIVSHVHGPWASTFGIGRGRAPFAARARSLRHSFSIPESC